MNDPDNFLSRWSRRKRETDKPKAENAEGPPAVTPAEGRTPEAGESDQASAAPAFDPDLLPPIESIGAGTDISDFLRPGVPEALRHAALRRVWSADPTIRDFVGINENYWDAAGPDGVPGFGALDPGFDVKRMVSELFGERPREAATPDQATGPGDPRDSRDSRDPRDPRGPGKPGDPSNPGDPAAPSAAGGISRAGAPAAEPEKPDEQRAAGDPLLSQRNENVALQIKDDSEPGREAPVANRSRRHGGAMPQ